MFRLLRVGYVLLLLHPLVACTGKSSGEISGISVSPDGKVVAVTFVKDKVFRIIELPRKQVRQAVLRKRRRARS